MNTRAQRRRYTAKWLSMLALILVLCCIAVGLWSFVNYQGVLAKSTKHMPTADADVALGIDGGDLEVAVVEKLEDSLSRPLLSSTRRPYVAPAAPKPPPPPPQVIPPKEIPPLDEQLVSVIMTGKRYIVFLNGAEGNTRLELGMSYKGWKLAKVSKDSAEFHFDNEKKILQLRTFATMAPTGMRKLGNK